MRRTGRGMGMGLLALCACTDPAQVVGTRFVETPEPARAMYWNYGAVPLAMPAGTLTGEAHAVNDSEQVVGFVEDPTSYNKLAVQWDAAGSPTLLNVTGATYGGEAFDINNLGNVVGALYGYGGLTQGVMWQGSTTWKLHAFPGDNESVGLGINERGTIVGYSAGASGRRAALWPGAGAGKNLHPVGTWTESQAEDINDRGDITGWVRDAYGTTHAFLWQRSGTTVDLGAGNIRWAFGSQAFGINNRVDVAGTNTVRFATRATVWYGSGQITAFPQSSGSAASISDNYCVVGHYLNGFEVAFTGTSAATYEDLPGLPPNYSNQAVARDVNTCGAIAGWLQRFNVGRRPVKWTKTACDRS